MPKRTAEENIEHYKSKIRKLKKKPQRRIRRLSSSSASEKETSMKDIEESPLQDAATALNRESTTPAAADLDPNILVALGETADQSSEFGENIHDNLARIWLPLLKKGLSKEARELLLKEYLIPENCSLLQAPTLNPEISAAIPESGRLRDKKMATAQQQLGVGIAAINRGLHLLINNKGSLEAIKFISDGCRILSDLHHQNTETRITFILPGLDKSSLQFLDRSERDQTLFGVDLPDKIKASKAITKQGEQIKKVLPPQNPSSSARLRPSNNRPGQYQGNWQGPSRFQSNRGGRGGHKRTSHSASPASSQPRTTYSQKPHASTRQ